MNSDSQLLQLKKKSAWSRYLLAGLLVFLGLCVRELSGRVTKELPLIGMPFAVFFAAYFGGVGPGLFATILAAFVTAYKLPPENTFRVVKFVDQVRLISFLGLGTLISLLSERARRLQLQSSANELALSESRYLTLIYQSPEPILVLREGIIRVINTPMVSLLGPIRRQGLLNEPLVDFVHPDDRELVKLWLSELRPGLCAVARFSAVCGLDGQIMEALVALEVFDSAVGRSVQVTLSELRSVRNPADETPASQDSAAAVASEAAVSEPASRLNLIKE